MVLRLVGLLLVLSATGCSGCSDSAADCPGGVEYQGRSYVEAGMSFTGPATELGTGGEASCGDSAQCDAGVYYPDDAPAVEVWELEGYEPSQVIGTQAPDGYRVLLAETLSTDAKRRLQATLARDDRVG